MVAKKNDFCGFYEMHVERWQGETSTKIGGSKNDGTSFCGRFNIRGN